jgi:hypothetical protein
MSRTERILRQMYDVRFLLVVVIITILIAILIPIRQNRLTNDSLKRTVEATRQTQLTNAATNAAIKDCSVPTGKCAKAQEKRLAEALTEIRRITVVANACAVILTKDEHVRTEAEILKAVDACIAKDLSITGGGR